ncbi:hypothetical protein HNY73_010070 [Argiope bruennichi]|uniref:Uncharacterized protein n=1 Tax=Argiope bruennichi TaxID=94029 RepID=A0A8T0F4Q2_ARGBR|nr:hypothetical protein HNY73_010070 [Argiope bruennichi]
MADGVLDVLYASLENHFETIDMALVSKCNMNHELREQAKNALGELKIAITKSFERLQSVNYRKACEESLAALVARPSYAEVVSPSRGDFVNNSRNSCPLIVSATESFENASSNDVQKMLKEVINPREKKIGIKNVRAIANNKVIVQCCSSADRDKLKNELKTNGLLQSAEPKGKNPALLVKNVPTEIDNNEIANIIFDQNPDIFADGESSKDINLKFTLKKFPNNRHVVCELPPNLHQKCLSSGYLHFEWSICRVENFVIINRCFKCLGYNHKAVDCRNSVACFKCAEEHKSEHCENTASQVCVNCIRYNKKIKDASKKVDVKHRPFADKSSLRVIQLNLHRSKIATQQLILNMDTSDIDVALVQEPYAYNGSLPFFPSSYRTYFNAGCDTIKAAIIVRNQELSTFFDLNNVDYNMVFIHITFNAFKFILLSYYFEPNRNIDLDLHKISEVFAVIDCRRLIWGMDANMALRAPAILI